MADDSLINTLEGVAEAIRDDIQQMRGDNSRAGDDDDRRAFLRGELAGIQQAIDIINRHTP